MRLALHMYRARSENRAGYMALPSDYPLFRPLSALIGLCSLPGNNHLICSSSRTRARFPFLRFGKNRHSAAGRAFVWQATPRSSSGFASEAVSSDSERSERDGPDSQSGWKSGGRERFKAGESRIESSYYSRVITRLRTIITIISLSLSLSLPFSVKKK